MDKEKSKAFKNAIKEHKRMFIFYVGIRALVLLTMIAQIRNKNYENAFLCIATLALFTLPELVEKNLKIELPDTLQVIIILFIFAAEILGEIQEYYLTLPFWDVLLHTVNGFIAGAIGFSLVDLLNKKKYITFFMSPIYMAIAAFCFSMTIGVFWEFFEFGMDKFVGTDMQKDTIIRSFSSVMLNPAGANSPVKLSDINSVVVNGKDLNLGGYLDIGLIDTMEDLFCNVIGAAVFSTFGFFFVKNRGKKGFVKKIIPRRRD